MTHHYFCCPTNLRIFYNSFVCIIGYNGRLFGLCWTTRLFSWCRTFRLASCRRASRLTGSWWTHLDILSKIKTVLSWLPLVYGTHFLSCVKQELKRPYLQYWLSFYCIKHKLLSLNHQDIVLPTFWNVDRIAICS